MTIRSLDSFIDDTGSFPKVRTVMCRTALSPSRLPGLDYALNPYKGCAHGCVYCYAPYVTKVPVSAWTDVIAKGNIAEVLSKEVPRPGIVGLGTVTDPYQPLEKGLCLTRRCLDVLRRSSTGTSILTKNALVVRDLDILSKMEQVEVGITITGNDERLCQAIEPGASSILDRLSAAKALIEAKVRTYVFLGPVIPGITDMDIGTLIERIQKMGVRDIMIDRLNIRPGIPERLVSTCSSVLSKEAVERLKYDWTMMVK